MSPSKAFDKLTRPQNPLSIGQRMSDHGLKIQDKTAFNKYPEFKRRATDIVKGNRDSCMKPESHQKLSLILELYGRANEATLGQHAFAKIMRDGYHLSDEWEGITEANKKRLMTDGMVYRDFLVDEGVVEMLDQSFIRTFLPSRFTNPQWEIELQQALAKMKDPKM